MADKLKVEEQKLLGTMSRRELVWRIAKTVAKVVVISLLYLVVLPFLQPFFQMAPELAASLEAFVVIYLVFMVIGDLTAKTIWHYVFNVASSFLVLSYLIYVLNNRLVSVTFEGVVLTLDLSLFYVTVVGLSLLGLARAFLQVINFLSEKAEVDLVK